MLDVAVHGRYNALARAYLRDRGLTPEFQDGDADVLAQGKPDLLLSTIIRRRPLPPAGAMVMMWLHAQATNNYAG